MPTYTSQYPPEQSDTYVKATTYVSASYYPHLTTDPTKPLTGPYTDNSWQTLELTNQRFHIDLGSAKVIRRIYYENLHSSGGLTDRGAKNFTFWGSNTAASFADLVYGNDEGWTELTVSQNTFDQHVALDQADPKYIVVTNATEYRYYAFKFADGHGSGDAMGVRRIELQTEDGWTPTFEYVGTGSFTYSGSGICLYERSEWEYTGSGAFSYSGEATISYTKYFLYDTSGSFVYSGEATISYTFNYLYVGDGQFIFSGTATQIYSRYYLYAGSGVFIYSGSGIYYCFYWNEEEKIAISWDEETKSTIDWIEEEK